MEITQQADYAVRAILDLTLRPNGERASCEEIARRQGIPVAFLTKICSRLAADGFVQSQRGVNGGVWLARPAQEITLLEVVEAIDGPILLNECVSPNGACTFGDDCPMKPIWCDTQAELVQRLKTATFANLNGNGH